MQWEHESSRADTIHSSGSDLSIATLQHPCTCTSFQAKVQGHFIGGDQFSGGDAQLMVHGSRLRDDFTGKLWSCDSAFQGLKQLKVEYVMSYEVVIIHLNFWIAYSMKCILGLNTLKPQDRIECTSNHLSLSQEKPQCLSNFLHFSSHHCHCFLISVYCPICNNGNCWFTGIDS